MSDPCECVFTHEAAMRRLLSLLRNSQNYCTDNECVQEFPNQDGVSGLFGGGSTMFLIMTMWMVMAIALFFFTTGFVTTFATRQTAAGQRWPRSESTTTSSAGPIEPSDKDNGENGRRQISDLTKNGFRFGRTLFFSSFFTDYCKTAFCRGYLYLRKKW